MNLKISLGAAIAVMLMVAAGVFSITMVYSQYTFNQKAADLERSREMYAKFTEVDREVRENYGGAINESELMDHVAEGYISGLNDRFSAYISAAEVKRLEGIKEGEDVGIGAALAVVPGGYLEVTEVYPDSPAQNAEIAEGDLIVKIDDTDLTPENAALMRTSIQGEAGTKLSLTVRKGSEDIVIPDLTRRAVAIPSVYSRIIESENIGYISIRQFYENTADQFTRELRRVTEAGAAGIIFDLRDNTGSSYPAAVRMLDRLIPEGVIYSATYRDGSVQVMEVSDANELMLPMAVLINSGTAEAAELFAQDLRDYGKAELVGAATAAKGVLLDRIKLSDGSAIDLTVAVINTMSGYAYDIAGVKPDFEVALSDPWINLDETNDPQLAKALEVVTAQRRAAETAQAESQAEVQPPDIASGPTPEPPPDETAPVVTPPQSPEGPEVIEGPEVNEEEIDAGEDVEPDEGGDTATPADAPG